MIAQANTEAVTRRQMHTHAVRVLPRVCKTPAIAAADAATDAATAAATAAVQEHFFAVPEPGDLAAKINWRIKKPDGDFIERSTIQVCVLWCHHFKQSPL